MQDFSEVSSNSLDAPKRSMFSQSKKPEELEIIPKNEGKKVLRLSYFIQRILRRKQNIQQSSILNEQQNWQYLKSKRKVDSGCFEKDASIHQCFQFFNSALQNAKCLRFLDLSGMDIDPIMAIEIGYAVQKNSSLYELNLSGCNLSTTSLQYIFHAISNHPTLQSIQLFNNQGFNNDLINDITEFVFKGQNCLKFLKLTHCNISSNALTKLLLNLKFSKTLTSLDISMMEFTNDVLISLGIALQQYKGKRILEHLNIGYCYIRNQGIEILTQSLGWNLRMINIKELILRKNFIDQNGAIRLESFLRKLRLLQKLDLSYNKLEEFTCQNLLSRSFYEINLSNNHFSSFPTSFFMNSLVINLSDNNITSKGAFQLSNILRQNPLWIELNLSHNQIKSEGFNSLIFGLRDNLFLKKILVVNNQLDGEALFTYIINHEQVNFEYLDISYNYIRYALIFFTLNFIKGGKLKCFRCNNLKEKVLFHRSPYNQTDENQAQELFYNNNEANYSGIDFNNEWSQVFFQLSSFNLRELDFSGNFFILSSVIYSLVNYYNKIEILDLSGCKLMNDHDLEEIANLLRNSNVISELNLSNTSIGQRGFNSVVYFRKSVLISTLKSLDLSRNQLFKLAKAVLEDKFTLNYRLESINYSCNGLESKHFFFIESALKCYQNLQELNLSHNQIDYTGLIMISKYLDQNNKLKKLNLSNQNFSADNFILLGQLLEASNINCLNLSCNPSFCKLKTFFNLCTNQRQDQVLLNNVYYDDCNFSNAIKILKKQRKNVVSIALNESYFGKQGLEKLGQELKHCKRLRIFMVNYRPFLNVESVQALKNITQNIRILQLRQVIFHGNTLGVLADLLSNPNLCSFQRLILIECLFLQQQFDILCDGIGKNNSIQSLIIEKCDLGNKNLNMFAKAIALNNSLLSISLENNNIKNNLENCIKIIAETGQKTIFKEVNISKNRLSQSTLSSLFSSKYSLKIQQLNLNECNLTLIDQFNSKNNISLFKNENFFNNVQFLSLSNNNLSDDTTLPLICFLQQCIYLQQLNLSQNQFTSNGMFKIFKVILKIQTINTLDISDNQIDDEFALQIEYQFEFCFSLQFLLLRSNKFKAHGQKALVKILKQQESLFIDNIWSLIDDKDADQILLQYTRIGQIYRLQQESMPSFLKEISFQKANLTDSFCESFKKFYPLLNFIEFIDISDNPYITMYGKAYLLFHLFDLSFEGHHLKTMFISDSKEIHKLFDDGLLRYLLFKFRKYLLPYNEVSIIKQDQIIQKEKKQQFRRNVNSWIFNRINKLLTRLDQIEPPKFIVSALFLGKFRRNNKGIKLIILFLWLAYIFLHLVQFGSLIKTEPSKFYSYQLMDVLKGQVFDSSSHNQFLYSFCLSLFIITIVDTIQLILIVILRQKIQPALQIVHPKLLKTLHSRFPTQREIILLLISIFKKIQTTPGRIFLTMLLQIDNSNLDIKPYQIIFSILIFGRGIDYCLASTVNCIQILFINPRQDIAYYLALLQRNFQYMNYYVPNDILVQFCPVKGYQINKQFKISSEIFMEGYRLFFFDFPLFFLLWKFSVKFQVFEFYDQQHSQFHIWLILFIIKSFLSICLSIINIFVSRPAVVKQNGFNQALTIKRFYQKKNHFTKPQDLKIEENINQFLKDVQNERDQKIQSNRQLELLKSSSSKSLDDQQNIDEQDEIDELSFMPVNEDLISSKSSVEDLDSPQTPLKQPQPRLKQKQ